MTPRVALSIAGSDSGGGAGIQADLKTFAAFGLFGTTAVTAVTAQDTTGVWRVHVVPPDVVEAQIRAVMNDLHPGAVKTGMLAEPEIITLVAELAASGLFPALVVDPVLVSTSGHALIGAGGVEAYRDLLLPESTVLTPNLPEAAALLGRTGAITSVDAMVEAAEELRHLGPTLVVIKGGHLARLGGEQTKSPDVMVGPDGSEVLWSPRIQSRNDHGTGCTLSAAIAAGIAAGATLENAVLAAKDFVTGTIEGAADWELGTGHGPLDHFGFSAVPGPRSPAGSDDSPVSPAP